MKAKILLLLFLFQTGLYAQTEKEITLAAASNIKGALTEIIALYAQNSNTKINVVYGASGKLTAQIVESAPFDIFIAADTHFPTILFNQKLTLNKPKVYALGKLVFWTRQTFNNDNWQRFIVQPEIKFVAIANPKTAPYGMATLEALTHYKLLGNVAPKFVYGESVMQAASFIHSGSANCGFVAKSVVLSDEMKNTGKWIEIPAKAYKPIAQSAVVLKHAAKNDKTVVFNFYHFLYSKSAQDIFTQYGYSLPKP